MKRMLSRVLILTGFIGALVFAQNVLYYKREATLRQIPKGASEAQVLELLGTPTRKTPDSWYYKETLLGLWRFDLRTDDMLVLFEGGKVEGAWMTPN